MVVIDRYCLDLLKKNAYSLKDMNYLFNLFLDLHKADHFHEKVRHNLFLFV